MICPPSHHPLTLSGSVSLSSTPFPVSLFESRSNLEKLADTYVGLTTLHNSPHFLPAGDALPSRRFTLGS